MINPQREQSLNSYVEAETPSPTYDPQEYETEIQKLDQKLTNQSNLYTNLEQQISILKQDLYRDKQSKNPEEDYNIKEISNTVSLLKDLNQLENPISIHIQNEISR